MNTVRAILAVLTIIVLLVGTLAGVDRHTAPFAILPLVCLLLISIASFRLAPHKEDLSESTASPRLLATRAPPVC